MHSIFTPETLKLFEIDDINVLTSLKLFDIIHTYIDVLNKYNNQLSNVESSEIIENIINTNNLLKKIYPVYQKDIIKSLIKIVIEPYRSILSDKIIPKKPEYIPLTMDEIFQHCWM